MRRVNEWANERVNHIMFERVNTPCDLLCHCHPYRILCIKWDTKISNNANTDDGNWAITHVHLRSGNLPDWYIYISVPDTISITFIQENIDPAMFFEFLVVRMVQGVVLRMDHYTRASTPVAKWGNSLKWHIYCLMSPEIIFIAFLRVSDQFEHFLHFLNYLLWDT